MDARLEVENDDMALPEEIFEMQISANIKRAERAAFFLLLGFVFVFLLLVMTRFRLFLDGAEIPPPRHTKITTEQLLYCKNESIWTMNDFKTSSVPATRCHLQTASCT